jgi:hypothetical protein
MPDGRWGHCEHCRFFGSPAQTPLVNEEAPCEHPELTRFHLIVFGASGCNAFELRAGAQTGVEPPIYDATMGVP